MLFPDLFFRLALELWFLPYLPYRAAKGVQEPANPERLTALPK